MFSRSVSFGCLWKLLGESFLLLESLPAEVAVLRVPTAILSNSSNTPTKSCSSSELTREEINKLQALKFSSKAFCRALNIQPQNVSCWQGKKSLVLRNRVRVINQNKYLSARLERTPWAHPLSARGQKNNNKNKLFCRFSAKLPLSHPRKRPRIGRAKDPGLSEP